MQNYTPATIKVGDIHMVDGKNYQCFFGNCSDCDFLAQNKESCLQTHLNCSQQPIFGEGVYFKEVINTEN